MRFLCVQCDESFESGEERPRCPKCMRIHGIQPLGAGGTTTEGRSRAGLYGLVGFVALAGVAAAVLLGRGDDGASEGAAGVVAKLEVKGVDVGELSAVLEADEPIAAFAQKAIAGHGDPVARARAVSAGLRARADKQAFVPWSLADPREAPPMVAAKVWSAIAEDGARQKLYPLEVSALAVAALRAVDVPAQVVEIQGYEGDRAPLDPSGCIGYYGVGVPAAGAGSDPKAGPDATGLTVFDPYGGRETTPKSGGVVPLSDGEVLAAALGLRALQAAVWKADSSAALVDVEAALSLWPNSASLRSARAVALAAGGGVREGERALEAAAQLRADAPRLNNLATYALQRGDVDTASKRVTGALERAPEFAAARVVLAGVHLAQGEPELAKAELDQAQRLDPDLPTLALGWAQYFAAKGDFDEAVRRAERAVELRSKQPLLHLTLGRLYRAAGRYDDLRRAARKALALTPQSRRSEMRQMIKAVLGPTALEEPEPSAATDEATEAEEDEGQADAPGAGTQDDSFSLSRGSKLLGGDRASGASDQGLQLGGSSRKPGLGGAKLNLDVELKP